MSQPENRPDPSDLLEAFVASGRSEKAFAALVESLRRLIFSSSLRRTGDSQVAEEVTQNVFAIMARKAESLRRHPALTAWALETTRFQSANAIRSERRRRRKLAALTREAEAQQPSSTEDMDQETSWRDAVPLLDEVLDSLSLKDRTAILQRFYEDKKFREMATENGQTEAACKMRVKRALGKLSNLLNARGVTLSTTVLASALGTELARSAPAQAATAMAPNALAASPTVSAASVFINTLQTMSTSKTIATAAATVVAISAIPFAQQRAEAKRLESELLALDKDAPEESAKLTAIQRPNGRSERAAFVREAYAASNLLASLNEPMEHREFLTSLMRMMDGGDPVRKALALARVSQMSVAEYSELLGALRDYPCRKFSKDWLLREIGDYAPEMTRRERVENLIANGSIGFDFYPMREWVKEDPDDALAWYREKVASGDIFGKGLDPEVQQTVFEGLLREIAPQRPELALEMYASTPPEDFGDNTVLSLTRGLTERMMDTGEEYHLLAMLELHGGNYQEKIVRNTAEWLASAGRFDEGMAFWARFDPDPAHHLDHVDQLFRNLKLQEFPSGLQWAITVTPQEDVPETFRRLGRTASHRAFDFDGWLAGQPAGAVRDYSYAGAVDAMVRNGNFEGALPAAQSIDDAELSRTTLEGLATDWLAHDEAEATEALPVELIRRPQN